MKKLRLLLFVSSIVTGFATLGLADTTDKGPKFEIKAGYSRDYVKRTEVKYYDIKAFGKTLFNQGSAPEFTDFAVGGLADVKGRPLFIRVERGLTDFGGSLLQGASTQSLDRYNAGLKDINFVLGVDAQLEALENTVYVAGLEYRPIFPISMLTKTPPFPAFLTIGFAGQRTQDKAGNRDDQLQATFRGMAAKSFYFRDPAASRETENGRRRAFPKVGDAAAAADIVAASEDADPYTKFVTPEVNKQAAQEVITKFTLLRDKIRNKKDASGNFVNKNAQVTQEQWDEYRKGEFLSGPPKEPDLVLWVDFNARYQFSEPQSGSRKRIIWSANAKYVLNPGSDRSMFIQAQYINGFSEATATKRTNSFVVSLGFKF